MKLVTVLLVCVILALGHAQDIHFNNTVDCSASCSIMDPSIYLNNMMPTINSAVHINNINPNNTFYLQSTILLSNGTFSVASFNMTNAHFTVYGNASFVVQEELSLAQVYFVLNDGSSVSVYEEAEFQGTTVYSLGFIHINELSSEQTFIFGWPNSTFVFNSFELEDGTIEVYAGSSFNVTEESSFEDSTITFHIAPYLGEEADFDSVDARFPYGFYVEEGYEISSSNFSAYLPSELANVTFELSGTNNLSLSNLVFDSNKIKINTTFLVPNITFNVINNATFDGNLTVPGQVVVNSGASVLFNGFVNLTGGLLAKVSSFTQIKAIGSLITGLPIQLLSRTLDSDSHNSFIVQNATIITPSLTLDHFVLHSYNGTTIIIGNVINNGSIHIFETSNVIIQGNYTQLANSTFGAYNLAPSRIINLLVNGSANINGEIRYNTTETKKKFTATLISCAGDLRGNFSTNTFLGDSKQFSPKLSYGPHDVKVEITPEKHHSWLGLHWWIWIVIGGGAVLVLIIVTVVSRNIRKRSKYQPV